MALSNCLGPLSPHCYTYATRITEKIQHAAKAKMRYREAIAREGPIHASPYYHVLIEPENERFYCANPEDAVEKACVGVIFRRLG